MPISPPLSVTTGSVHARHTGHHAKGQSWQIALDDASASATAPATPQVQQTHPTTSPVQETSRDQKHTTTLQTMSTRPGVGNIQASARPDDMPLASGSDIQPPTPAASKDSKKDTPQNSAQVGAAIVPVEMTILPATPTTEITLKADDKSRPASIDSVQAKVAHASVDLSQPDAPATPALVTAVKAEITPPEQTMTTAGTAASTSEQTATAVKIEASTPPQTVATAGKVASTLEQTVTATDRPDTQEVHVAAAKPHINAISTNPAATATSHPAPIVASNQPDMPVPPTLATVSAETPRPDTTDIKPVSAHAPHQTVALTETAKPAHSPAATVTASIPGQLAQTTPQTQSAPSMSVNPGADKPSALAGGTDIAVSAATANRSATPHASLMRAVDVVAASPVVSAQPATDLKKTASLTQTIQPVVATGTVSPLSATMTVDKSAQINGPADQGSVNLAPAALSATITALHHAGQSAVTLRLDPPELGHLSVQIKMDAQGGVNVLFIPSTADAAQALQASFHQLGNAMAQSGLMLSQAQVGGQFSQSGGQPGQQGGYTPPRQNAPTTANTTTAAATDQVSGLSAYA